MLDALRAFLSREENVGLQARERWSVLLGATGSVSLDITDE
jgi:hypothetical protein